MTVSEYTIIDRATDANGRVIIPPHLALEFTSDDEADAALIDRAASRRIIAWQESDIIAGRILLALNRCSTATDRRSTMDAKLRHYAHLFGDIHRETARKRFKCGYWFPPTTADGQLVRVPDKPITLYENALVALRYDDDPVAWVLWAIDNDIPAHKVRQYIEAAHSEGPAVITTRPLLFDGSLPVDSLRVPHVNESLRVALVSMATDPTLTHVTDHNVLLAVTVVAHVADAVHTALLSGTLDRHGDLTALTVRVLAECEQAAPERDEMPVAENAALAVLEAV